MYTLLSFLNTMSNQKIISWCDLAVAHYVRSFIWFRMIIIQQQIHWCWVEFSSGSKSSVLVLLNFIDMISCQNMPPPLSTAEVFSCFYGCQHLASCIFLFLFWGLLVLEDEVWSILDVIFLFSSCLFTPFCMFH